MRFCELDSPLDMDLRLDHGGLAVGAGEHGGGREDKGNSTARSGGDFGR